jgi:asparagine synthase (glutamine-hydrolysing)
MIFGITGNSTSDQRGSSAEQLISLFGEQDNVGVARFIVSAPDAIVMMQPNWVPTLDVNLAAYHCPKTGSFAAFHGSLFNRRELIAQYGGATHLQAQSNAAEVALRLLFDQGERAFAQLNGSFALALWDGALQRFYLVRDHLGIESVFYCRQQGVLYFSNNLQRLAQAPAAGCRLNLNALYRYLLFNYNPGYDTFYEDVHALRPGCFLKIEHGRMSIEQYWRPSFAEVFDKEEATYKTELLELLHDAVRIRLAPEGFRPGAFLSGGMDSSSVVHFMHETLQKPVATFSFRCRGKSFDESHYARIMSERYHTQHHQVEYTPEDAAARIVQIAQAAQEPFSDIGIEVASWLLGNHVREHADYVLTGDGGDELFGGHPVYLADRAAEVFDKVPGFIRAPLAKSLLLLPDTDDKKSLAVKAKRFSYSTGFPASLYSNRWRIYYTGEEVRRLLHPDLTARLNGFDPFRELHEIYQEADGRDHLSRTLYGDYYSVVGFYLRRMELIRNFGVEGRMPLLDYRLVDYTARIPSALKIDKRGATKVILHRVMAGVLPDEIVFRKDKLGHSGP